MIFVKIFESYDAVAWRKLISKLNGTPFHLPEIWTVGVNHDSLRYLIWEENDTPVAASIGIVEKRRFLKFVDRGAGLRLPTAPVLGEKFSILREELYIALQRECMDQGYRGVIVDSRWGEDPGVADRLGLSAVFPLVEFLVDLTQGEENLLRTMHKKHRKNIRLAQESGVSIENSISVDDFLCLQSMQQSSIMTWLNFSKSSLKLMHSTFKSLSFKLQQILTLKFMIRWCPRTKKQSTRRNLMRFM